jgi:NADH:ubiquinone oxidoreductase subunit 3 (subunit A)
MRDMPAYHSYAPVLILMVAAIGMAVAIVVMSHLIGPKRRGPTKDSTYESGMPVVGDARRRFHVRFYIVAMLFLLFDVEVVFLWPWAPLFHDAASAKPSSLASQMMRDGFGKEFLLVEMAAFVAVLLVGYAYAWRKGIFKWT